MPRASASKTAGAPVDSRTVFQIGSAAKTFLATTIAIAVDRGERHWDDRVVDLDPEFQLKDRPCGSAGRRSGGWNRGVSSSVYYIASS